MEHFDGMMGRARSRGRCYGSGRNWNVWIYNDKRISLGKGRLYGWIGQDSLPL